MALPPCSSLLQLCPHGRSVNFVPEDGLGRASYCDECRFDLVNISRGSSEASQSLTKFAQDCLKNHPQFRQEVLQMASRLGEMAYTAEDYRERLDHEESNMRISMAAAPSYAPPASPRATYSQPYSGLASSSTLNNAGLYGTNIGIGSDVRLPPITHDTNTGIGSGVRLPPITWAGLERPRSPSPEYRPATPTLRRPTPMELKDHAYPYVPFSRPARLRSRPNDLIPTQPAESQGAQSRNPDEWFQFEAPPSAPANENNRGGWDNGDFRGFDNGNGQDEESIPDHGDGDVLPAQPPDAKELDESSSCSSEQQQQQEPQPQPETEPEPGPQLQYQPWPPI
ncbi:hypothetical protein F4813DRAFT_384831 [Daldinia decipiens]|uniref:uncharacterized protein n=1 Tax=Daldinia decipiens TaxID=326647 RepID=UPI0020C558A6|nr:uncharacterized protein F4813DRAFT_384831 [Daldinia decipiens]KAI1662117.1 hypothetical protein F4813DRAFT_384831 [Daldinia decipiens]